MHRFLTLILITLLTPLTLMAQDLNGFRRGINLSHWHAQVFDPRGYTNDYFFSKITQQDIDLISRLGFDHVRVSVEPDGLFNNEQPGQLNKSRLYALDVGLRMILKSRLNVILDIHPGEEFKQRLIEDPEARAAFIKNWSALAAHHANHPPQRLWFELLNEPLDYPDDLWQTFQTDIARAVRAAAPNHTIIAAADRWSGIDELLKLKPLEMDNVVYNFHCYDPFIFTHQGANWAGPVPQQVSMVPYPSTPDNVRILIDNTTDVDVIQWLTDYGNQQWNAQRINQRIDQAGDWARQHNVPIMCNEFGVYIPHARAEDRITWSRHMRQALERNGIVWTMWDYKGGFGIADDNLNPNYALAQALGLRPRR
ncbi:glycoside hydrolase family 5 protein [Mucisphaera calidilacus]|uniref:Endoglucanase C307 n=1 Tax=Mucisphaera calidilacus TaxID=2527982 RepID=A0A518BXJ5_9BACT|nr:cellulase family glycosylhydrolase [Mucisphaera calidilacus]QDU71701.1 Endoglucanase C307 precursor [Mucisphaera calidilacus]